MFKNVSTPELVSIADIINKLDDSINNYDPSRIEPSETKHYILEKDQLLLIVLAGSVCVLFDSDMDILASTDSKLLSELGYLLYDDYSVETSDEVWREIRLTELSYRTII